MKRSFISLLLSFFLLSPLALGQGRGELVNVAPATGAKSLDLAVLEPIQLLPGAEGPSPSNKIRPALRISQSGKGFPVRRINPPQQNILPPACALLPAH